MPRRMLWSALTHSPSSRTSTVAAYWSAPRRMSSASLLPWAMICCERSSAARVSSRSSMRNAACSWARARMRSASSWARSTRRVVSSLMRLACRTSSGTATRSWSMRSSALTWSTTTELVMGMRRPLAISASRRSMRKMMSMGVDLERDVAARDCIAPRGCYGRRCRSTARGTMELTSPPRLAISRTMVELT